MRIVDRIVEHCGTEREALIPILQGLQKELGYLPDDALHSVCEKTSITPAQLEGVVSFFSRFRRKPVGEHMVSVCDGTACHVKGAEAVYDALRRKLNLGDGEDTDTEGTFTLQKVACLGCCTLAPAVQIDHVTYGHVAGEGVGEMLTDFLAREEKRATDEAIDAEGPSQGELRIGLGSCCVAGGSAEVRDALEDELRKQRIRVDVKPVGCVGMCHRTPLLELVTADGQEHLYANIKAEDVPQILDRHFASREPLKRWGAKIERLLEKVYSDQAAKTVAAHAVDVRDKPLSRFLGRQQHLATELGGVLNPGDLQEYRDRRGFEAFEKALKMEPAQVVDEVLKSGLRGRGGAGFPTGGKWFAVSNQSGKKVVICNGDEGDPGAFMDRMILESYPYRVIEGMLIASRAVGAHEGIFYIRAEYPLAVKRVRQAIADCEAANLLGDNILGSDHSFSLRIMEGAGAFVCGEESALIASLEGRRGMPAQRPPYPAEKGFQDRPTLVNNVETFALVSWILREGAEKFKAIGTPDSPGTKVFSLAGKIARGGLIEVPMGITIREVVEEIGGGVAGDRQFKAVQIGGPSGGCIPASLADTTIDFEALSGVGAMMGSGGLVVLDDHDCMVEMARYFLSFTQSESCGKCTPCRVGTRRMLDILDRLCDGKGRPGDIEQLEELAEVVQKQSLCALGKTAPNPVLTTLRFFREEFEAHIAGNCPAGKCTSMISYSIDDTCIGCGKCLRDCPVDAITGKPYEPFTLNADICVRCDHCRQICPVNAITVS